MSIVTDLGKRRSREQIIHDQRHEIRKLKVALGHAISSPKGVVPKSAEEFYDDKHGVIL